MPQTIGRPIVRKEDVRLVVGRGRYSDDVSLLGQAYAVFVRSPHAHAHVRSIDTAAARAMPGVPGGADWNRRRGRQIEFDTA